jgi:hypothetical protein
VVSASEGRFPRSLLEFRAALRRTARARNTFSRAVGPTGLSARVAAEVALGGFRPKPSPMSAPIAVGRPR